VVGEDDSEGLIRFQLESLVKSPGLSRALNIVAIPVAVIIKIILEVIGQVFNAVGSNFVTSIEETVLKVF